MREPETRRAFVFLSRATQVRIARATRSLERLLPFYTEGLGLKEQGDREAPRSRARLSLRESLRVRAELTPDVKERLSQAKYLHEVMRIVACQPEFQEGVGRMGTDFEWGDTLKILARIASRNPDFMLLHCITVGGCLWDLEERFSLLDTTPLRESYRELVMATLLARGLGEREVSAGAEAEKGRVVPPLSTILSRVLHAEEEHAIKSVFALVRVHERTSEPVFLHAAWAYAEQYFT